MYPIKSYACSILGATQLKPSPSEHSCRSTVRRRFRLLLVSIQRQEPRCERPERVQLHKQFLQSRIAELKSLISKGGFRECLVRGALYVGMARGSVDERGFELVRRMREADGDDVAPDALRSRRWSASSISCCSSTTKPPWRDSIAAATERREACKRSWRSCAILVRPRPNLPDEAFERVGGLPLMSKAQVRKVIRQVSRAGDQDKLQAKAS